MSSIAKTSVRAYQNYVNGQWVSSASGKTFPVYDPSTEEVIAQVAASESADVERAVKAARAAFDSGPWPKTTAQDRGRILFRLAEKVRQNSATLAEIFCRQQQRHCCFGASPVVSGFVAPGRGSPGFCGPCCCACGGLVG